MLGRFVIFAFFVPSLALTQETGQSVQHAPMTDQEVPPAIGFEGAPGVGRDVEQVPETAQDFELAIEQEPGLPQTRDFQAPATPLGHGVIFAIRDNDPVALQPMLSEEGETRFIERLISRSMSQSSVCRRGRSRTPCPSPRAQAKRRRRPKAGSDAPRGMPPDLDAGIREAFRLLRADLVLYEAAAARAVKVPLAPHDFDALVSFHYNTGGIARAALTGQLNAGDRAAAARQSATSSCTAATPAGPYRCGPLMPTGG